MYNEKGLKSVIANDPRINFVPLFKLHIMTTIVKMDEITTKVKEIITDKLGLEGSTLERNARFTNDLGLDSLDVLETFTELEKKFHIRIADEDVERLTTVGAVIDYIVVRAN
jgi:acyl carrier protein